MTDLFIKPAPGCLVRDPRTLKPLDAEGETKPKTPYWLRRLREGSVVKTDRPKASATKPKAATTRKPKTKPAVAAPAPTVVPADEE
ncbi:DUF2635 domain-containing protein [Aeromonas enteropelogenes]|uniref:DUF2635 domain-containing protein n=1 Tax=Aeromonas enteropelogenes TaxID=29489 RepID=UPI003BA3AABF